MKYRLLVTPVCFMLLFSGCLEIEEGVTVKENGSGTYEMNMDLGKVLEAAGPKFKEQKINTDSVLRYDQYLDTAQSISDIEIAMLRKVYWKMKVNTDKNTWHMTLVYDFNDPIEINRVVSLLQQWDNTDILDMTLNSLFRNEEMEGGEAGNKPFGDMTRDYFKLDWQNGKFTKTLDSLAYKKIGDDISLNSFRKLGEVIQAGDVLENIIVTTKFVLPRAAVKAEGKNLSLSEDRTVIKIKTPVSDIYADPHNFEYEIEY